MIDSDNGSEITSNATLAWQEERGVGWHYIAGHGEAMLRMDANRCRMHLSSRSTAGCSQVWQTDYKEERPHTSLGGLTPNEFASGSKEDGIPNRLWLCPRTPRGQGQHPRDGRMKLYAWR